MKTQWVSHMMNLRLFHRGSNVEFLSQIKVVDKFIG